MRVYVYVWTTGKEGKITVITVATRGSTGPKFRDFGATTEEQEQRGRGSRR